MKKLWMLLALLCIVMAAACSKPRTTENNVHLQGKTEAVLYTVKAPVDGESGA